MHIKKPTLDEYTLAAFLSGQLPRQQRLEVAAQLADDDDALSLLVSARDLLESTGDGRRRQHARNPVLSVPGAPPPPVRERRLQQVFWGLSITVLLAVLVSVSYVAIRVGSDLEERYAAAGGGVVDATWIPRLHSQHPGFSWPADPDASSYALVIWDEQQKTEAVRVLTDRTAVSADHPQIGSLRVGAPYRIWVESLGPAGQRLRQTRSVHLRTD